MVHPCIISIVHAPTRTIVHEYMIATVNTCAMAVMLACILAILHAYTLATIHECIMAIGHACRSHLRLMFIEVKVGGSGERRSLYKPGIIPFHVRTNNHVGLYFWPSNRL